MKRVVSDSGILAQNVEAFKLTTLYRLKLCILTCASYHHDAPAHYTLCNTIVRPPYLHPQRRPDSCELAGGHSVLHINMHIFLAQNLRWWSLPLSACTTVQSHH